MWGICVAWWLDGDNVDERGGAIEKGSNCYPALARSLTRSHASVRVIACAS